MIVALLALAAALPAAASPAPAWVPLPRVVLGLYDPALIPGPVKETQFLDLHQNVELPLNHLGLVLEFADASKPLPDPARRDVIGAVAWFPAQAAFDDPRPVCRWFSRALAAGKRVVLLGQLGVYEKAAPATLAPECAAALRSLGVAASGLAPVDPAGAAITTAAAMMGFERRPSLDEATVPLVRALPGGRPQVRVDLGDGSSPVDPVVLTPRGAVALDPFLFFSNNRVDPPRKAWVLDPFAFFEAAFGVAGRPRPDPYTLSGRRLFMTRIDGDGFFNVSEADRRRTAGVQFTTSFLERMTDTPFTVSLISGYYDLALYNDPASLHAGRRAFARPNVEPASHTRAHPLVWRTLKSSLTIPRYRPDYRGETAGSARRLEELLLPRGRRVGLLQWSGDCQPVEAAVAAAEDAGLLQINGGGGRFDAAFPSLSHLFPIGRQVGARRQIYAPASNENDYTELWSARYYGYRDAVETFRRSGSPRRLKPVDVYVHFYSAERYASEKSLRDVYAWARTQPLIPVFGGRYARAARDFYRAALEAGGPGRFRVLGAPDLRTVRFDGTRLWPDLRRSKGVIGWRREGDSLYVALDRGEAREIALGEREGPGVRLEEADFEVDAWTPSPDGVSFEKSGWWDGWCVLAGLRPGARYRVRAGAFEATLTADARGRLEIAFGGSERGGPPTRVTVARA